MSGRCSYCAKEGATHLDHVVPRSRGGPDAPFNIVLACEQCNLKKGDMVPSEWLDSPPPLITMVELRVTKMLASKFAKRGKTRAKQALENLCEQIEEEVFLSEGMVYTAKIVEEPPDGLWRSMSDLDRTMTEREKLFELGRVRGLKDTLEAIRHGGFY